MGKDPEQGNVHQSSQRSEARKALDGLDRDAHSVVLGALAERVPGDVLAAVALWESIEASR